MGRFFKRKKQNMLENTIANFPPKKWREQKKIKNENPKQLRQ